MNAFDSILVAVGIGLIALCLYLRTVRALLMVIGLGIAIVPAAILYTMVAHYLAAIGQGAMLEGIVFFMLTAIFALVIFLVGKWAMPDTTLPSLGFVDYLLGGVLGVAFAALALTVIMITLAHTVSAPGTSRMVFNWWSTSGLRPTLNQVLRFYNGFVGFFFPEGYPYILLPR